jgi:hypothetical protein
MKPIGWLAGVGSVLVLMACGGGGSAQSSGGVAEPAVPVRISGVVARGAALVEAKVLARCGSGPLVSATSGSSGAYTLEVEASALPCVLQAVSADGIWTLHSVARGSADTLAVTAHITTLTELLVAQLAGTAPSVFMAQATARTLGTTVTPANIAKAQVSVAGVLQRMGVNPAPISDVLGQPLVAASAVQRGNAHDKVLDALAESMHSSGAKLADLIALVGSRARTL